MHGIHRQIHTCPVSRVHTSLRFSWSCQLLLSHRLAHTYVFDYFRFIELHLKMEALSMHFSHYMIMDLLEIMREGAKTIVVGKGVTFIEVKTLFQIYAI